MNAELTNYEQKVLSLSGRMKGTEISRLLGISPGDRNKAGKKMTPKEKRYWHGAGS